MKSKFTRFLFIATILLVGGLPFCNLLHSQEITEGTDYWFGLPFAKFKQPEYIRNYDSPIIIWISSKVNTAAHIQNPETGVTYNVSVQANKVSQFNFNDALMNRESEVVTNKGIHVTSDDPVSVYVYYSYQWTGEAFRCIPTDWIGKEYVTLNLYQDETDEIKPAQILITATQDRTQVSYTPTFNTEKCYKGATKTVTLNKGQTYLILAQMTPGLTQVWDSDLTGTYIKSDKPISVISGHTKGTFPLYCVGYVYTGDQNYANFSRNMLCEMLWPVELLGTEYISAPFKYNNRIYGGSHVQDERGDLIRFVAPYDDTKIFQLRQNGTSYMQIGPTLKKGQWYNITNQESPALYRSTKPVLVGQYGKAWWSDPGMMGYLAKTKDDQPQNPWLNGQGMMIILAPIDRWCSYATFRSPENIDNFFYLTFKYSDRDNIYFDNQKITSAFGGGIQQLVNSGYAYITEPVGAADHYVEGKNGAKFAGYSYGNWDRCKDGFAYGYPIGMNFADPCLDSLYVKDSILCGDVKGEFYAVDMQADTSCASIFTESYNSSTLYNYTFVPQKDFKSGDKTFSFELKINNILDSAFATVEVMSRSGRKLSKTYHYYPEDVNANPTYINFGMLPADSQNCSEFILSNPTKIPVTIIDLFLKKNSPEFVIDKSSLPLTLQPGDTKNIKVCGTAIVETPIPVTDSIIAQLSCYNKGIVALELRSGQPDIYIPDYDWGQVPVNNERPKTVTIENRGISNAEIYGVTWNDHTHFIRIEGFDATPTNPIIIKAGETFNFTVYYKPNQVGVLNTDSASFATNAVKTKLYSLWQGIGIDVGPTITGKDWDRKRIIDDWQLSQTPQITNYDGTIQLGCEGNTQLNVTKVVIEGDNDKVFTFNSNMVPQTLNQGTLVDVNVYFAPAEEKEYTATIKLISEFNGNEKIATAQLHGIGIEPHINVTGYNFDTLKVGLSSPYQTCFVEHKKKSDMTAMQLTLIDKLAITGPDKDAFDIRPDWESSEPNTQVITIDNVLDVPVRFTPKRAGAHFAQIVAKSDAPKTDNHIGDLQGFGFIEGIEATNYTFPTIFITKVDHNGIVSLINTGTKEIQITRDIEQSLFGPDAASFTIDDWYIASNLRDKPYAPFTLSAGDSLNVKVTFHPLENKVPYNAWIVYETSIGEATSLITGGAMVLLTTAEIPKYWSDPPHIEIKPGEFQPVDFKFYKSGNEAKQLIEGDIQSFVATVEYNIGSSEIDVMPDVKTKGDIITTGTMTDGWTCTDVTVSNNMMKVSMTTNNTGLTTGAGDVLFRFRMNSFLSSKTSDPIKLKTTFTPVDRPYVIVENIDGDMKISPVCVNQLRLVLLSQITYNMTNPSPNPAGSNSDIDYSIAFDGRTTMAMFDAFGNKVASLVDGNLSAGSYRLSINFDALGLASGTYFIRMNSGEFTDTKSVVIVK